jgi:hypothetical protein
MKPLKKAVITVQKEPGSILSIKQVLTIKDKVHTESNLRIEND